MCLACVLLCKVAFGFRFSAAWKRLTLRSQPASRHVCVQLQGERSGSAQRPTPVYSSGAVQLSLSIALLYIHLQIFWTFGWNRQFYILSFSPSLSKAQFLSLFSWRTLSTATVLLAQSSGSRRTQGCGLRSGRRIPRLRAYRVTPGASAVA